MTQSRIASARREAGLTQVQLAGLVGVSVDTIRRAEQGKHETRILTLLAMSRAMEVPLERLLPEEHVCT